MATPLSHAPQDGSVAGRKPPSDDISIALASLLDACLVPDKVERLLILVYRSRRLTGILGAGWDHEVASNFNVRMNDEESPVAEAFRSGKNSILHLKHHRDGLIPGRYLLLPLHGIGTAPYGALLIGPEERALESFARTVALMDAIGPAIERIALEFGARRSSENNRRDRDIMKTALDALPDPVLVTDSGKNILLHNRRAEFLFSTNPGDGERRRRAVEGNTRVFSSLLADSAIGEDVPSVRELNLVHPSDGADLLIEALVTPRSRIRGGAETNVSVLRDVTDLKRATTELEVQFKRLRQVEAKSRRERDRLNMILEHVGNPILVTDERSDIILLNREAERLFETAPLEADGVRHSRDVRANGMRFSSFVADFALSPDTTLIAPLFLTDPETGLEFPAETISGKVLNERGEVEVIVSILHDLTEVVENRRLAGELARVNESLSGRIQAATRELEERNRELEVQSRELEQSYRLQTQFLASMSHELRTPINSLLGYTSLLRDHIYGEMTEQQEEAMERMYLASHHLLELVNDILDLAKIEAGKMPVHVSDVAVGTIIQEIGRTVDPLVRGKALELHIDVEPALPVIRTDGTKVKQIILNLVSNAVKFTREGEVRVRAFSRTDLQGERRGIEISVTDTGIGIGAHDVQKIFEDFRQIDESTTREHGGTGLGLSITKKLLALLGGTIHVESTVGEGSTFSVCLPLRSDEILLDRTAHAESG